MFATLKQKGQDIRMIHAIVTREDNNDLHLLRLEITKESIPDFIALVNRSLNCWDNAPQELKDLGHKLTHGGCELNSVPTRN